MLVDYVKLQLDLLVAPAELAMTRLGGQFLGRIAPVSARKLPVITLPGFLSTGKSAFTRMNEFLDQQGFKTRTWGLGRNRGLPRGSDWNRNLDEIERFMADRIRALADECSAPVSLVGHSLGGVYARELALRMESEIDRVIMLGSPTFHPYRTDRHNKIIQGFSYWVNRQRAEEFGGRGGLVHWSPDRPALPCVAIHSPLDGFVDENACHIPGYIVAQCGQKAPRENIRVLASHIGMTVNSLVWLAVADRLLTDRNNWLPFDPRSYFPKHMHPFLRLWYPSADELWQDRGASAFVEMNQ